MKMRSIGGWLLAASLALPGCGGDDKNAGATTGGATGTAKSVQAGAPATTPGAMKGMPGGQGRPDAPPTPVAVEPTSRGDIASYYATTATLEAEKNADILARVSGVVTSIPAEEGDRVTAGSPLLSIQDEEYKLRLQQADAEAEKQKTRFARLEKMYAGTLVSAEEFDTAKSDLDAAEAARDLARLQLSYTKVTAPFTGRATRRHVNPGQNVNPGTVLFTLADMDPLLARVHVPAKEFRSIRRDQPVELILDSTGETLRGNITLVSPVIDPTSGTIKVTVEIGDHPSDARPGEFAQVRIVTERHAGSLLVPKAAVIADKGEQIVYVAAADSTAERRIVQVGFQDDVHAEIVTGLKDGEQIVVQGQRSLKHGATLRILPRMTFPETAKAESVDKAS